MNFESCPAYTNEEKMSKIPEEPVFDKEVNQEFGAHPQQKPLGLVTEVSPIGLFTVHSIGRKNGHPVAFI